MISARNAQTARFYDWACHWYPVVEPWLKGRRKRLISEVNARPEGALLEIGVGTGGHLGDYQRHEVHAVDVSPVMVARARRHAGSGRVVVSQMDGEALSYASETFDYVVLCHVLSVTADAAGMMREVNRVLREGGLVYVLNRETPAHALLERLDRVLSWLGRVLHLRLWFRLDDIPGIERFRVIQRRRCGWFGYFTFSILQK